MSRPNIILQSLSFAMRAALVAVVLSAAAPTASHANEQQLQSLFVRVLINPDDIALNLEYANLAEELGLTRKALSAYERILIQHPDNEDAKEGFYRVRRSLEPEFTDITVDLGGRYETNARQLSSRESRKDDFTARAKISVLDEHKVGSTRWRTEASFLGDLHYDVHDLDYARAEVMTGPVVSVGKTLRVHTAVGGSYAVLDKEELLAEAAIKIGIEGILEGALDKLEIRAGYQDLGNKFSDADAIVVDVVGRLTRSNVLMGNDVLAAYPRLKFSKPSNSSGSATTPDRLFPGDYIQGGATLAYYMPLISDIVFGITANGYYRDYDQEVRNGSKDRRDIFLSPGAQVVFKDVLGLKSSLRLEYRYEKNLSNDDFEDFDNHVVTIRAVRKF